MNWIDLFKSIKYTTVEPLVLDLFNLFNDLRGTRRDYDDLRMRCTLQLV